jgi:mono/diheme cytochrome c family protein
MTMSTYRESARLWLLPAFLVLATGLTLFAQARIPPAGPASRADFSPKPPIVAQSAEEQAKSFVLPPGYRMELVLSDPDVDTPAVVEFDGNGRMYVAEFVTYMPDLDGTGQREPKSRISRWEDTNADGKYDTHTVFVDKLILPRMILPLDRDSILTNETDSDDVVKWTDTNGDGVADKRELFFSGVGIGRDGNLEHEQSGFVWGLDNWIYSTYNSFRFRWTPTGIVREPTGPNGGQWGLSQDDDGKMWFVCAGCERGPVNFQVPIHYGAFRASDEYEPGFDVVWPISGAGDMQGGMFRVRSPIGVVNHATATCGPDIVRGHRLPEDLVGDLLFAEPVGRLIRRAKIVKTDGLTQLRNAYPGSEFLLSTDPLFRPVNIRTAPDGTVYIADMYRGIIQEGEWTRAGSYLRLKIQQYQMDKVTHRGRIWRLRFDGTPEFPGTPAGPAAVAIPGQPAVPALEPDRTQPRMLNETPAQLVTHLSHPNGWWRDTAQRLLVLKQDRSVVPALQNITRTSKNLLERFHAMWTLEGLGALDAALVREQMEDANPRMRIQALRASETLYKAGEKSLADAFRAATKDTDPDVALQAMLTINVLKLADAPAVIKTMVDATQSRGIQEIGKILLTPPAAGRGGRGGFGMTPAELDLLQRGETIYGELCFSCHGPDGRGAPMAGAPAGTMMAPPLSGSPRVQGHRDYVVKVLLNGLTGPLNDKTYTQVMVPMGQKDDWIAAIASYVRNSFGNTGSTVSVADVARVRAATGSRKTFWTQPELEASLPQLLQTQSAWKITASHNPASAQGAATLTGWTSGVPQQSGMWLQVELPEPSMLSEVQFNSPAGSGRGGGPQAPAPPAAAGAAPGAPAGAAPAPGAAQPASSGAPAPAAGAPATPSPSGTQPTQGAPAGRGAPAPGGSGAAPPATALPPRDYQVQVSRDGNKWTSVARGQFATQTLAAFAPVRAKFVRITETAAPQGLGPLVIQNVRLYQAPAPSSAR